VPTVLISGDVHSGWLNSAALAALGLPVPRTVDEADRTGPVSEDPWFDAMNRLSALPGTMELVESGFGRVLPRALARGVTGIVDMETSTDPGMWARRAARLLGGAAHTLPRIRAAIYRQQLDQWRAAGLRSDAALPDVPRGALLTQGPLKVISDGSMGAMTALVVDPYPAALGLPAGRGHGVANIGRDELAHRPHAPRGGGGL